jgi:hypothetical protein
MFRTGHSQISAKRSSSPTPVASPANGSKLSNLDDTQTSRRGALPAKAVSVLKAWLREKASNPYPDPEDKEMYAAY